MGRAIFDLYASTESPIHRLEPRTKIILVAVFVLCVVSTHPTHLQAFVVYAGLISWACAIARVPLSYVLIRAAGVLPFSVLASIWLPFMQGGGGATELILLDGSIRLSVSGLWLFAGVAMKSFLGASVAVWLISTTPFNTLLGALRQLGAPRIIVDLLSLTYRYLFVFVDEAIRLRRAAAVRGYRPKWLGQVLLIGRLVGRLFLRSYERAERVYGAMVLRGFTGQMPISKRQRLARVDIVLLLVAIPAIVMIRIYLR